MRRKNGFLNDWTPVGIVVLSLATLVLIGVVGLVIFIILSM